MVYSLSRVYMAYLPALPSAGAGNTNFYKLNDPALMVKRRRLVTGLLQISGSHNPDNTI